MRSTLKQARIAADMTQQQVADYLEITTRNYQKIESGQMLGSIKN